MKIPLTQVVATPIRRSGTALLAQPLFLGSTFHRITIVGTPTLSIFVLLVITLSLGGMLVIYSFTGVWLLPRWLTLILVSYYPFYALFRLLDDVFFGSLEKRKDNIYHWGPVLHWGYMLCVAVHFYLIFGVGWSFLKAFGAAVGACIVVPISVYRIIRPIQVRHSGTERMSPGKVAAVAQRNESFDRFLRTIPDARVFVTDTEHRYRFARVCALHRFPRPEDPGVVQETVFEVQVDMRRKRVVEESEVFQTYLYRTEEDGYAVLVLPIQRDAWRPGEPAKIARATLQQLATVPARFPNLDRYPLPIASRNREAVEVCIEEDHEG